MIISNRYLMYLPFALLLRCITPVIYTGEKRLAVLNDNKKTITI